MRAMASLLTVAGSVYVLLCLAVYFFQARMVFLPHVPGRVLTASPEDVGLAFENVTILTDDAERIHGWYVASGSAQRSRGVVLFFHGNAGNVSHRLDSIRIFSQLGLDVLIIDYRGYGESTGKPGESGIYEDGEAAWQYLVNERGVDPGLIIVFGRSLGAVVATRVAGRHGPAGLIIESGFTSGADMAKRIYPWLPVRLITRLDFPLVDFLSEVRCPTLVIHSRDDEIIPFDMGRSIFDATTVEDKTFVEIRGGHNTGFYLSASVYLPALQAFIRKAFERRP